MDDFGDTDPLLEHSDGDDDDDEVRPQVVRLLSNRSPVVILDRWYPWFTNFYSIISVDVIRKKSHVNIFLESSRVPVWVSINKLPSYKLKQFKARWSHFLLSDNSSSTVSFKRIPITL